MHSIGEILLEEFFEKVEPLREIQPPDIILNGVARQFCNIFPNAVRKDLSERGQEQAVELIDRLSELCCLLAKPENHIKVRTGQYAEKKVYIRNESDMRMEMIKELANLPRYTAWVKTLGASGETVRSKTEIYDIDKRFCLNPFRESYIENRVWIGHKFQSARRDLIEEEIAKRQAPWRQNAPTPPSTSKTKPAERQADKPDKRTPPRGIPT